jgi:hypothetical protein
MAMAKDRMASGRCKYRRGERGCRKGRGGCILFCVNTEGGKQYSRRRWEVVQGSRKVQRARNMAEQAESAPLTLS